MKSLVIFVTVLSLSSAIIPNSFFKKCSEKDTAINECLTKTTQDIWPQFVKGDPKYHIASFSPFEVLEIIVNINNILYGRLSDANLTGYDGIQFRNVSIDFNNKKIQTVFYQPLLNFYGPYELDGLLIDTPIKGIGICNISFYGLLQKYEFSYDFKEKDGVKYLNIIKSHLSFEDVEKNEYFFDNLFDGNVELGVQTHNFLNNNWKIVFEFIKYDAGNALAKVYSIALQMLFDKVPFNEFFN